MKELLIEKIDIKCSSECNGFKTEKILSETPIRKKSNLTFNGETKNLKDYEILW